MYSMESFLTELQNLRTFSYLIVDVENQLILSTSSPHAYSIEERHFFSTRVSNQVLVNFYHSKEQLIYFKYQVPTDSVNIILFIENRKHHLTSNIHTLLSISNLIHLKLTNTNLSDHQRALIDTDTFCIENDVLHQTTSDLIESNHFHLNPFLEKKMFQAITYGDEQRLRDTYSIMKQNENLLGTFAKDSLLRHKKNQLITTIALSTRHAIEGGVIQEHAYQLSDALNQKIESISHLDALSNKAFDIMLLFCREVQKSRFSNFSNPIKETCQYIYNHIYNDLSLKVIATHIGYSPSHLSKKFKQEVGQTITSFILEAKIEESKKLISYSDKDLNTISNLLNFTDYSYFIKVFKRHEKCTPKEYLLLKNY